MVKPKGFNNGAYIPFSDEAQPQEFVASTEFALQKEDISSLDLNNGYAKSKFPKHYRVTIKAASTQRQSNL